MKVFTIYKATCTVNNKVYIGFDSSWPKRIANHKCASQKENTKFYRAIRKHGFDSFIWEPIYQSLDKDHTLKEMEPYFIREYNSKEQGYNSTLGGDGNLGFSPSAEQRAKMSQSQKGLKKPGAGNFNPMSEEKRERLRKLNSGRVASQESREKISSALKDKKKSVSHIEAMKTRWQDNIEITCPHCNKTGQYKNMMRWHMDRCKNNPKRSEDLIKEITCEYCHYTSIQSPNFYRYHGSHCKMFTEITPTTTTLPSTSLEV